MKDKKVAISIRVDEGLLEKLKTDAKKEYRPLSLHIRKILSEYLKDKNSN